ncbi:MAG: AAA family ATPase [Planctomycetota bacterium]|jgi:pilus assembly protein CpaE
MEKNGKITVAMDIKNQKVVNDINESVSTLKGFSISHKRINLQNPDIYDILILEIGNEPEVELQFAKNLKASGIARDVFLTSSNTDPEILIKAIRAGIKEFFPQPINKEDVKNALIKVKSENKEANDGNSVQKGKIINVFGSKGGVGTTTIAVNLAASLAEREDSSSVALIDMKPVFGEISTILNLETNFSWLEVTRNISRLDPTYLMSILTKHPSGVYVLPSPVELTKDDAVNPQALATLLRLMQTMFDFIVIDSGQSFDDSSREVIKISDTVLLVCELSLSCIINIKRLQDTFQKYGLLEEEKVGIIVNRFVRNSEISLKDAEESLSKKVMFSIPNAYKITMNAIVQGKPISTAAHGTEIWRKYRELASTFPVNGVEERSKKEKKRSFHFSSIFS